MVILTWIKPYLYACCATGGMYTATIKTLVNSLSRSQLRKVDILQTQSIQNFLNYFIHSFKDTIICLRKLHKSNNISETSHNILRVNLEYFEKIVIMFEKQVVISRICNVSRKKVIRQKRKVSISKKILLYAIFCWVQTVQEHT